MARRFPRVQSDIDSKCFKCGGVLGAHRDSSYPVGSGARRADCTACEVSTWYDLPSLTLSTVEG